jgi:glycosylphosphatidylinositol transamidase
MSFTAKRVFTANICLREWSGNSHVSPCKDLVLTNNATALLPGQVHTYFANSEHNVRYTCTLLLNLTLTDGHQVFRAYRHEVASFEHITSSERTSRIKDIFSTHGLKTATQSYNYTSPSGEVLKAGENVYAILQGPRADATEAMVLIGAWRNADNVINYSGVALVLTLARYFSRWSLWSKDIIFLIPEDSTAGPQAWVDAYHEAHNPEFASPLPLKSGALQGAIALDYPAGPWGHRFDKLHIVYDGINGALPNLDLFNTAVSIASGQMGISCTLQRMWKHDDRYTSRLSAMLRGMLNQGLGHATGPHSPFIPYHVDAITLQTVGDGWHDEMSLGRTVEGLFRSLNNLLEHLHQSFFFYLLMHSNRFVSIGTYLPSAMLVAGSFTIMCIALWVQSGRSDSSPVNPASTTPSSSRSGTAKEKPGMTILKSGDAVAVIPTAQVETKERLLFLPLTLLTALHFASLLPLKALHTLPTSLLAPFLLTFTALTLPAPYLAAFALPKALGRGLTRQEKELTQCFSLMALGLFLSALATLNFSLALIVGVLAFPYSFIRPLAAPTLTSRLLNALQVLTLTALAPPVVIAAAAQGVSSLGIEGAGLGEVLSMAMGGWWVHGVWTSLVVWCVWWPAWFAASFVVGCGLFSSAS